MFRAALPLALVLCAADASAAECDATTSTASLQSTLDAAEAAFGRVDVDGFRSAMTQVRDALPCLDEKVPSPMAAQVHRLEGLAAFVDQANDRSMQAFAAARSIEPTYTFPSAVVPPGNPVLERYLELDPTGPVEAMPAPLEGQVHLDGKPTDARPTERPALLQVMAESGPRVSSYLWPDDPLPYDAASGTSRGSSRGLKLGLLAGGGAVAAIGLGTLAAGALTSPSTDDTLDDAFAKSTRNDTLAGIGGALAVLGGAGVGVSFLLPTKER